MNVPAGKLGSQFQSLVNQYTGSNNSTSEIPLQIGLGGSFTDPKVTLLAQEQKEQVKEAITTAAQEKGKQAVQDLLAGEKPKDALNNLLNPKKDSTAKPASADSTKTDVKQEAQKALENKLQNLLKKKKN